MFSPYIPTILSSILCPNLQIFYAYRALSSIN